MIVVKNQGILMRILYGFLIGVGAIAPGLSGSVIAIALGWYDAIIDALAHPFKDIKKKVLKLWPIGLGGAIGILIFSNIIDYLFLHYPQPLKYFFTGLVLGSLPEIAVRANQGGFKKSYLWSLALFSAIALGLGFWQQGSIGEVIQGPITFIHHIFHGMIIGLGSIVPGLSASFMLMFLGAYQPLMAAIANIEVKVLFFVGIGFLASVILLSRLVSYLLKRFHGWAYYGMMGFVAGSAIIIFPGFPQGGIHWGVMVVCIVAGTLGSRCMQAHSR